ncbi:MAG: GAF domain-containing protein [Calditrichaeota bacterium]|nr:MAG: GAF domain-containing protein [Calditrichota bacterium]
MVLTTTVGHKASSVCITRLRLEEGLVGKVLRELQHIVLEKASLHLEFKNFPETVEDPYECFLAVPMRCGVERIGVLVLQRESPHKFTESEVCLLCAALSSQDVLLR